MTAHDDRGPIRPASGEDAERIEQMIAAAFEAHVQRIGFPPIQLLSDHSEAIDSGNVWVAGDPIVAAITLRELDQVVVVENLVVDPGVQGVGLGRRLMDFAEDFGRQRQAALIVLHHNDVNRHHQGFFLHLGYQEIERRNGYGAHFGFLEKPLRKRASA